jgi:hypothetical protein
MDNGTVSGIAVTCIAVVAGIAVVVAGIAAVAGIAVVPAAAAASILFCKRV